MNKNSITSIFFFPLSLFTCLFIYLAVLSSPSSVLAGPASHSYELKEFGFGSGGTTNSQSSQYALAAIAGENEAGKSGSTNYSSGNGLTYTLQSNLPLSPNFTNPNQYSNKLKLVLNRAGNPADTKFAIAISPDNFASSTFYIQNDNTIGPVLGPEDWQTYNQWGDGNGFYVIGLESGTTYTVKVTAAQGKFTQTGFGPTAQASTVNPSLTFDIDVASTDTETNPPFTVNLGELLIQTVKTAANKIWFDLDTNGAGGGSIYVYGANSGLSSSTSGHVITSMSGNLNSLKEGYGARGVYANQTTGGPLRIVAPYDGNQNNVGALDTNKRILVDTSANIISGGRAAFEIKAIVSAVTPAENDYADTITVIASASF